MNRTWQPFLGLATGVIIVAAGLATDTTWVKWLMVVGGVITIVGSAIMLFRR